MTSLNRFVARWRIQTQILSATSLLLLPLGVLFYFNIEQVNYHLEVAREEIAGVEMQAPLIEWLALDPAQAAKRSIDSATAAAAAGQLKLSGQWQAIAGKSGPDAGQVRQLITTAADQSNLILDPELDTYYLMDVAALTIPQALERLNTVNQRLQKTERGSAEELRLWLSGQRLMVVEADRDRVLAGLERAVAENGKAARGSRAGLAANLRPAEERYRAAVERYLQALSNAAKGSGRRAGSEEEMARIESELRLALVELLRTTSSELRALLEMRIDYYSGYRAKVVTGTGIALGAATILLWFLIRGITNPLRAVVDHLSLLAQRDLRRSLDAIHLERQDEVGEVARASQSLLVSMRTVIGELNQNAQSLLRASSSLRTNTETLSQGVEETLNRAQSTAAAAEEMSVNVQSMAVSMEETSTNVDQVATAADRMNSSIQEIHAKTIETRQRMAEASEQAEQIQTQMQRLSGAAQAIGQITETIQSISAQTNLLALNATIEAARAGAAGKGFAVVANEIKDLALQTAAATGDIRERIGGVQSSAAASTEVLEHVVEIVRDVEALVASVTTTMDSQTGVTGEITGNMQEAATGAREAKQRLAESSLVSTEIARDAAGVNQVAQSLAEANERFAAEAQQLAAMADRLSDTVAQFTMPAGTAG